MSSRYPLIGVDDSSTLPDPSTTSTTNSPSHAGLHANTNAAVKALETKLGTGSSTPASGTLLIGTGTGTSAWSQVTSSQLAASISDETGTGSAVFANTPTLITPKADVVQEATSGNGVTVAGVNLKSGVVTTSGVTNSGNYSQSSGTFSVPTGAVSATALSSSAITLGYAQVTTNQAVTATTATQLTGLTTTVAIPSGGRRVEITVFLGQAASTASSFNQLTIWDGTVGTGTCLSTSSMSITSGFNFVFMVMAVVQPSAGSKTYNVGINTNTGTLNTNPGTTSPAFMLVKLI